MKKTINFGKVNCQEKGFADEHVYCLIHSKGNLYLHFQNINTPPQVLQLKISGKNIKILNLKG